MNRRNMVMAGVAAAAGLAGAGVWWKSQPQPTSGAAAGANPASGIQIASVQAEGVVKTFWSASFDTPDGASLAMSAFQGRPLLVNFWATWCPPCVEELPLLNSFYNANKDKSWQLLGLAVDQPSAVRAWLKSKPLDFPVGMAGFGGTELSKSFGNLSGGLPFSVVFSSTGKLLHRKTGKLTPEDLALWAQLK